jgi:hypothetical protein
MGNSNPRKLSSEFTLTLSSRVTLHIKIHMKCIVSETVDPHPPGGLSLFFRGP